MNDDKRASPRKYLKYPAQIDFGDGQGPRRCALADLSVTGARVLIAEAPKTGKQVTLLFSSDATGRQCRVIWQRDKELGLEFVVPADGKRSFDSGRLSRRNAVS